MRPRAHSHPLVIRPAAAFRRHPIYNLVRVHDVARFAVDTVGEVYLKATLSRRAVFDHLVHGGGAEPLARVSVLLRAARRADVRVENVKMHGLVFVVRDCRVVNVRHLVEGELAVEAKPAVALIHVVAVIAVVLQLLQGRVPRLKARAVEESPRATARDELKTRVRESEPAPVFERRVKVPNAPKLRRYPALSAFK